MSSMVGLVEVGISSWAANYAWVDASSTASMDTFR
jgi:hypothetical protein